MGKGNSGSNQRTASTSVDWLEAGCASALPPSRGCRW